MMFRLNVWSELPENYTSKSHFFVHVDLHVLEEIPCTLFILQKSGKLNWIFSNFLLVYYVAKIWTFQQVIQ